MSTKLNKLRTEVEDGRNSYYITHKKAFVPLDALPMEIVKKTFGFAFDMTFGGRGEHRNHRSGGQVHRMQGEVFSNAFQGKLAEFGLWIELNKGGILCPEPSLDVWKLGKWDFTDMEVSGKKLCIKSAKFFSNLVLLETKDWDDKGLYIPNIELGHAYYDLFFLVRIRPNTEGIMSGGGFLHTNEADKKQVETILIKENWEFDLPGFAIHEQVVEVIGNEQILPQNSYLTGRTRMDAENYYIQSGDLIAFQKIKDFLG